MRLAVRRTWAFVVLAAALGAAGCGPKVYRLTAMAWTSNVSYTESLARMDDQPNTPRYRIRVGETGVFAVSRYQMARLKDFSVRGVKVTQLGSREDVLREGERKDFSFAAPGDGRVRVSTALSSNACCAGIAFVKTSVAVEEARGKVSVVLDCDLPLARMVLVELRPVADGAAWTWIILNAYRLPDSRAAGREEAPSGGDRSR